MKTKFNNGRLWSRMIEKVIWAIIFVILGAALYCYRSKPKMSSDYPDCWASTDGITKEVAVTTPPYNHEFYMIVFENLRWEYKLLKRHAL